MSQGTLLITRKPDRDEVFQEWLASCRSVHKTANDHWEIRSASEPFAIQIDCVTPGLVLARWAKYERTRLFAICSYVKFVTRTFVSRWQFVQFHIMLEMTQELHLIENSSRKMQVQGPFKTCSTLLEHHAARLQGLHYYSLRLWSAGAFFIIPMSGTPFVVDCTVLPHVRWNVSFYT